MKATRDPEKFNPITIVIETEDEAINLWHRLNAPNAEVKPSVGAEEFNGASYREADVMWLTFDAVYQPPSRRKSK